MLDSLAFRSLAPQGKLAGMSIHEKIKARRTELGMSMQDLADAVSELEGLTKKLGWQTVQQWENKTSAPKRTRLSHVATALKTTVNDLLAEGGANLESDDLAHYTSQGTGIVPATSKELSMQESSSAPGYVRLPILAEAAAGVGRDPGAIELIEHVDVAEDWVRRTLRANPASLRVLTARGHSMTGQIEDGDALFVQPCTDFVDDGLYVIAVGGLLRVKRLRVRVIDQVLSIESNDGSPAETIPLSQVDDTLRICGRVIGSWSLRRH